MKKKLTLAVLLLAVIGGESVYFTQYYPEQAEIRKLGDLLERIQHYKDVKASEELEKLPAERLRVLAEKGYPAAQFQLAQVYESNNQKEFAKKWYEKAAAQNYAEAYYQLSYLDEQREDEYLEKAIQLGSYNAKNFQALRLVTVKGDNLSAIMLLTQNAEAGFPEAQAYLGNAYFYGDGVKQDWQKAFYWYSEAYKNIKINNSSDFFVLWGGSVDFDIYQNLATLYLLGLGTPKNDKMVEELINKCNLHLGCKNKKINDITDLKLNILSRDNLPKQPDLQEKIEAIKEELVLSKDPKVLIKLGELEKDKSKAKKYFGDACDLRSQEGCDKYRELNQKQDTNK
ncbi:TPA: tetratricopeptide repeat protein [Haemophilus influenzae]|uniref:tetratricopeptide repeat protein n=1 Tax=Haemophilus influenzae TaxID=727 RepID=UPI000DD4577C|nr:tetratricopeptide repeat protein [Haemophilus influenzae]